MSPLLLLALFVPQTAAACATHGGPGTDADGDGWCTNDTPADCNDSLLFLGATINPGLSEDATDRADEDCDGSRAVRRDYVTSFDKLTEFTVNRATLYAGGEALLSPVLGDPAWVKLNNGYTFESGSMHVGVAMTAITGSPSCNLIVDSSSTVATSYPLTLGVQQVAVSGVRPGDTIDRLEVRCAGGSSTNARVDWLTAQNGPYEWAPMRDLAMTASTMAFPSTGRQSVLRVSEDYDGEAGILMAGSDVGGFAWTYPHDPDCDDGTPGCDPTVWQTANGTVSDLQDGADYAVWEVYAEAGTSTFGYDVLMLTGSQTHGGLWRSTDLGADDWTLVDGGLSAFKHRDDCPSHEDKELSSGRLIVEYPSYHEWTLIASGDDANRGIFFWQAGVAAEEKYTGLPEDGSYEALPSALATHLVADDGQPNDPKEVLLVGYRPIVTTATGFDGNALYLCPADFDPASATGECVPVIDSGDEDILQDVRDIEVSPFVAGQFFVADGGRTYSGGTTCTYGESSVYIVEAWIDAAGDYQFDVRDTDLSPEDLPDPPPGPSWNDAEDYYDASVNCVGATGFSYGDLVAPSPNGANEAHALSTITFEPSAGLLFGFYPAPDHGSREYGCVRAFRADVSAPNPDGTLAWRPFQDYENGDMNYATSPHAEARRGQVDARGGFMESEPLLDVWAPGAVHDAVFVERTDGYPDLLIGGNFHWWAFRDADGTSTADVGWDSPAHVSSPAACGTVNDLDCADFALAWGGDLSTPVFQDTTGHSLAVRPAQALLKDTDDLIGGGVGDYKMAVMHGGSPSLREPADRSCEAHKIASAGWQVSTWVSPDTGTAQAWMAMHPQKVKGKLNPYADPLIARGILFGDEDAIGELGDEWCWDAVQNTAGTTGLAGSNFLRDWGVGYDWRLTCQDSGYTGPTWLPCNTDTNPWNMETDGVGVPRSLVAVGQDTALLVTSAAYMDDEDDDVFVDADSAGLWMVEWNGTAGLDYTKVAFHPDGAGDLCDAGKLFQYDATLNARNRVAFDPTSSIAGTMRAFVNSRDPDCGLYEVTFTKAGAATADWTKLLPAAGTSACTLAGTKLEGATVSPDGEWVLAWGSDGNRDTTYDGGVCAIELATGNGTMAVPGASAKNEIWTLIHHPHVEDTWYYGLLQSKEDCTTCTTPGVYALQRRFRADTSTWSWESTRLSGDDLEHRTVVDLDFGPGTASVAPAVRHLYVTTAGGGFWDGSVSW